MIKLQSERWESDLMCNIRKNLNYILEKYYESNQTLMAKDLDIKTNTLFTYINTGTKPPITFIYKLCSRHNLSIDLFLRDEIAVDIEKSKKKEVVKQFYGKYIGCYYAYFFVVDSNSLKEGLIQEGSMTIDEGGNINFEILNTGKKFSGILSTSEEIIYFDLKNAKEKMTIAVKGPGRNIREKYIGGMGITNISSPEDNRIPSAQKIIISRARISVDKYFRTLSEFLEVNTYFKIKKRRLIAILSEILNTNIESHAELSALLEDNKISGEDKLIIGEKELNLIQLELGKEQFLLFKRQILDNKNGGHVIRFNGIKINQDEDKMVYRFIKNEFQ
jgi:hypothetical protein